MRIAGSLVLASLLTLSLAAAAWGQALPTCQARAGRALIERLDRITQMVRNDVEKGRLPGRRGAGSRAKARWPTHEAMVSRDKAAGAPMQKDPIFLALLEDEAVYVGGGHELGWMRASLLTDPVDAICRSSAKLQVRHREDGVLTPRWTPSAPITIRTCSVTPQVLPTVSLASRW